MKNIIFITLFLPNLLHAQLATNWWNKSVFYEMFVRSFYDSDSNGIGDFNGITAKLDYLNDGDSSTSSDLGIKGIWLMPINSSPSYHGYDVTNYSNVNKQYGSQANFKNMVKEAHKRGIKIIIDFVINHTSSQHPWFIKSAANDSFYRNFYIWNTSKPNYKGPWGQDVWYTKNNSNYYALFWSEMPDLNYNYKPVQDSIYAYAKYWLDSMDIDGFRLDAAMYLYENGSGLSNQAETFKFWEDFSSYCKAIKPSAFTIGEAWTNTSTVASYNNKLDNCFEFDLASSILNSFEKSNSIGIRQEIQYAYNNLLYNQYGTFLTNHDQNRVYDVLAGNTEKIKAAASVYLTLPGTPYIYYGEEIAMQGSKPDEGIRTPMQWSTNTNAGFTKVAPWQSVNSNFTNYNVASMQTDTNSVLNHYKKLIHTRNKYQALQTGNYFNCIASDTAAYTFIRQKDNQVFLVMINLSNRYINNLDVNLAMANLSDNNYSLTDVINNNKQQNVFITSSNINNQTLNPYQCKILLLDKVSFIKEVEQQAKILLYPNPSKNLLTIEVESTYESKNIVLNIFNLQGNIVEQHYILNNQSNIINIEKLDAGMYFIKTNNSSAIKLIKE